MVMVSLVTLARRRVRGELWREEESTTVATMAHVCTLSRRLVLRTYSVPKSRPEVLSKAIFVHQIL